MKRKYHLLIPAFCSGLFVFLYLLFFSNGMAGYWLVFVAGFGAFIGNVLLKVRTGSKL